MKKKLIITVLILISISSFSQISIYVSNNGTNKGSVLPTIDNPAKTLENAYNYINKNLTDINNLVTTSVNIYLMDIGGDIMVSDTNNSLIWNISGSSSNPIVITSHKERATLARNLDIGKTLILKNVNHITIKNIKFNRISSGAILMMNTNYCQISYNIFKGSDKSDLIPQQSTGIIWIGNCTGNSAENCPKPHQYSSFNKISNNKFYNLYTYVKPPETQKKNQHHAIYVSHFTQKNSIYNNTIIDPPSHGIHFWHGFNSYNIVTRNLITQNQDNGNGNHGIILGVNDQQYSDGQPYSSYVVQNEIVDNYINDPVNNKGVIELGTNPSTGNLISPNWFSNSLKPNDPYWLNYTANNITNRLVSGDFDRDGYEDDIAAFYDYGNETKIHVWKSMGKDNAFEYSSSNGWWHGTSYSASKIHKRVVSGDFDRDGYKDDIAAFYDYGGGKTRIHVWKSNGYSFSSPVTWWSPNSWYSANNISGRLISGDFDRDGYEDDIAAFHDYGGGKTRIHVWLTNTSFWGTVTGFNYQWSSGWWNVDGYDANKITDRVVSGDFNRDGYKDDIAAFYDYGDNQTRIHIWKSTGKSFKYSGKKGWWNVNGYNANKITNRIISGDFDRDGYKDGIAAFYDYENSKTNLHTWQSTGTSFKYSGKKGLWNMNGYTSSKINGRIAVGDFDKDGKINDITAFYDYSNTCGNIRSHVWSSSNKNISQINGILGYPWMIKNPLSKEQTNLNRINSAKNELLTAYPNPSKNILHFQFEVEPYKIKIFNRQGEIILDKKIRTNPFSINVEKYKKGIYYYKAISSENKSFKGRFIVE